jgi:hypothetical protein
VDEEEMTVSDTQNHNEVPDSPSTSTPLQNLDLVVDEEDVTVFDTQNHNEGLDSSSTSTSAQNIDLVDEEEMTVSDTQNHNEVPDSSSASTSLQNLDLVVDDEEMTVADTQNHNEGLDSSSASTSLPNVDLVEEEMTVYDTQKHNEGLDSSSASTSVRNVVLVDEEEMTLSDTATLHNDNQIVEDLSTILQKLDQSDETDLQMVLDTMGEDSTVLAVSLPKCFSYDRWNQTMLSDEASQEFVLWAHFGFWRHPFALPWSTPLSPLHWPDFSANLELMRFLTIMDPEFSILPGNSCRSWDSLVDLAPSVKRIETLQDAVGGGDDNGRHNDFLHHVPLVEVVGDFLWQKRQQMQKVATTISHTRRLAT